jgi:hypothetical protein
MTVVELLVAFSILTVVMLSIFNVVQRDTQLAQSTLGISVAEMNAQQMLRELESELADARGANPIASITQTVSVGTTTNIQVDSTLGFPDDGMLLVERGGEDEERILYANLEAGQVRFVGLVRGQQCTTASSHPIGSELMWAGLAETLEEQETPPPGSWDGVALSALGPSYFRGDGTGFSYRVPVDPSDSTPPDYLDGDDLQWGAELDGLGTLDGWMALSFVPRDVLFESATGDDLNGDRDTDDAFDVGQLRRSCWDTTDPTAQPSSLGMGPANVLQERCNWGGDLDGDGFDDPIFLWDEDARRLHVRLFIVGRSVSNIPIVRRVESVIFLRNDPAG